MATTGLQAALAISTGGTSPLATGLFDRASEDQLCEELLEFIEKGEATVESGAAPDDQGDAPAQ